MGVNKLNNNKEKRKKERKKMCLKKPFISVTGVGVGHKTAKMHSVL